MASPIAVIDSDIPKEELAVEVADIYCVHVDNVNVLEAGEREVGQDFAS